MTKRSKVILLHVLVWIQFIILPYIFFPKPLDIYRSGESGSLIISILLSNVFFIGIFYFNYLIAIPKYYFKHLYYTYGTIIFFTFIISTLIAWFLKMEQPTRALLDRNDDPPLFGSMIIRLIIVLVASFGLKMYERWRQTELEKANVELSYLKAQINPHFLFNTLNGIYALAVKKSDDTAGSIVKLSSIMRYVISDANEEFVSLDKEIKYVSDYIDLQKMRLNKNVNVNFVQEGNFIGKRVVPMLFISFIENAFKYGVSASEESQINITIKLFRTDLTIEIQNTIHKTHAKVEDETKIGIENSRRRLEQYYPNSHTLTITEEENRFFVNLLIQVK